MLSGSHENHFLGNHIIDSSQYGINLAVANDNTFYHNNFLDNAIQAYENHRVYWWWLQNDTYYSEGNTFDNGEEGNYWSDYTGVDEDGDGIGETPHPVYENFTDRYPLTTPFDVNSVTIVPETWSPLPSPEPTPTPIQSATPEPTHSPDPTPTANSFPIIPVAIVSAASAAIVGLGLLVCLKKSRKPKNV
jgi:parallel beta-helix repeat protein